MAKVLILGGAGFIGSNLKRSLVVAGHDVETPPIDILDYEALLKMFAKERWEWVLHLAGVSHVATCEQDPANALRVNVLGTSNILETMRRAAPQAHLIFSSTAQVYRPPTDGKPLDEDGSIAPWNMYARAKAAAEALIRQYCDNGDLSATVLRLFNHTHSSQPPNFFLPEIYRRLKTAVETGEQVVSVGNLDLLRDIGSIQDLCRAFDQLLQAKHRLGQFEVFNLCSGSAKSLRLIAQQVAERIGARVDFRLDESRLRPGEPACIVGSSDKLSRTIGWSSQCRTEVDLVNNFFESLR